MHCDIAKGFLRDILFCGILAHSNGFCLFGVFFQISGSNTDSRVYQEQLQLGWPFLLMPSFIYVGVFWSFWRVA